MECPAEASAGDDSLLEHLERHLPSAIARVRRSLKPKRVLAVSPELRPFLSQLSEAALGSPVFYTPLSVAQAAQAQEIAAFREALPALLAQGA